MEYLKKYKKVLQKNHGTEQWWYFVKLEDTTNTNLKANDVFAEIYNGIKESNVNAEILHQSIILGGFYVFPKFLNVEKMLLFFKAKKKNLVPKGFVREFPMALSDGTIRKGTITMKKIISDGTTGIYNALTTIINDETDEPELFEVRIKQFGDIKDKNSGKVHY